MGHLVIRVSYQGCHNAREAKQSTEQTGQQRTTLDGGNHSYGCSSPSVQPSTAETGDGTTGDEDRGRLRHCADEGADLE